MHACSNLLVLDEVMQHLDAEGCARVAALLKQVGAAPPPACSATRKRSKGTRSHTHPTHPPTPHAQLPYSTALVVSQAHGFATQAFDSVDVVVKAAGAGSRVERAAGGAGGGWARVSRGVGAHA